MTSVKHSEITQPPKIALHFDSVCHKCWSEIPLASVNLHMQGTNFGKMMFVRIGRSYVSVIASTLHAEGRLQPPSGYHVAIRLNSVFNRAFHMQMRMPTHSLINISCRMQCAEGSVGSCVIELQPTLVSKFVYTIMQTRQQLAMQSLITSKEPHQHVMLLVADTKSAGAW